MDLSIIPECYIDTNLIETIVPSAKGYNHQKGCGTVARLMKRKFHDMFAVGIIDKDKRLIKYLEEFKIEIESENLQLFRHKDLKRHHYMIVINPAIERWILTNVEQASISLKDFDIPTEFEEFKKITKRITSKKDEKLKKLFIELKKCNPINVAILSKWIEYLKAKRYEVDLEKLRAITGKLSAGS